MEISPILAGAAAVALGPALLMIVGRTRIYRHEPLTDRSMESLAKEYESWESKFTLIFCLCLVPAVAMTWLLFLGMARLQRYLLRSAEWVLTVPILAYVLPAIFIGIFVAALPGYYIGLRVLGPDRYREFDDYQNRKYNVNAARLGKHAAAILIYLSLVSAFLLLDSYVLVSGQGIVLDPLLDVRRLSYDWNEIESIVETKSFEAPNGNRVQDRPYFSIRMVDGRELNFHEALFDIPFDEQKRLIGFVSVRSGVEPIVDDPFPR